MNELMSSYGCALCKRVNKENTMEKKNRVAISLFKVKIKKITQNINLGINGCWEEDEVNFGGL